MLDDRGNDPLAVPIMSAGPLETEPLICIPAKARLWWLRRGATVAGKIALGSLIP